MTEPAYVQTTRASYDAIAADYAEVYRTVLEDRPLDRAILAAFAELVRDAGPVADVGCGPGRVTAYLHSLGVQVFGVDLSAGMLEIARAEHPHVAYRQGSMAALDEPDGSLAGISAWYSIIHTPPERVPAIFAEFHRLLAPGGHLLVAFQVGEEPKRYSEAFGHEVSLEFHRWTPDAAAHLLTEAGFTEVARMLREPEEQEPTSQAALLLRKPS
ncbi:class I SAM-dependent DNA methyltransferase [Actinomadura macrotermitis]|uniref:Trans-aconitate 2-methyltransferase n=1 Tax=Actinomadura macrotermitis TaxID=2585200 RepID=A0A7K0BYU5_9ACTN|nr:class I SAM-dependent methyltransferase [Actinomadura macrotermitis]MQY05824.1 Trans-aconitate 2-methyltransferase [Actinomadura macrotermitis]